MLCIFRACSQLRGVCSRGVPSEASNCSGNLRWIQLTMTHVGCGACGRRMGNIEVSKLCVPLLRDFGSRDSRIFDGCSMERLAF